ncbi:MAG: lytic transglycosylase domain-containing protein [Pseudomonadota bacterium]|nr:lytic transglycosylase domain-containing protein [Pseudomonadota bacterium]
MIGNYFRIKFFFLLIFSIPLTSQALEPPKPKARPEIKIGTYKDVFDQIRKQNWSMAIVLADDYKDRNLSSYIKWLDITRPGSNHSFDYLTGFLNKHQNWPKKDVILEKIESSINKDLDSIKILDWFKKNPPNTSKGKIDYLERLIETGQLKEFKEKQRRIKDIWIKSNLTYKQQRYFIRKYSKFWDQTDNWKRFDRLIYEGKTVSARRTLNRITGDLRKLGEARLGLSRRTGNVENLIYNVPKSLKNNPGLIYERMRWRRKAKLDTAGDLLLDPPEKIENVRNLWINSRIIVRRLINKKEFFRAYEILKDHNLPITTQSGLEAEWLAGWVSFTHLKKTTKAIKHFENVFNNSDNNFRSKAAYWIALANIRNKSDKSIIRKWFKESAKNEFSFYGQNASLKIGELTIEKEQISFKEPAKYKDLIEVIKIIKNSKQDIKKTYPFFDQLIELSSIDQEKYFILEEALKLSNKSLVVKLSKKLEKPSVKYSYPIIEEIIPEKFQSSRPTMSLIHAIIHQESNFSINAYSSAGARGLMQLMPFTAKKVSKDLRIKYYRKKLTQNPQYNILLGTTYINQMLKKFGNSLPLALAAYNAGPNRVRIWLKRYGDPRKNQISYIDWMESIPISETRFYVQKVLSNLRIYQKKYNVDLYK